MSGETCKEETRVEDSSRSFLIASIQPRLSHLHARGGVHVLWCIPRRAIQTCQLSLSSSLIVKSSASAAHARSRSAVVLAHACKHTHDPHIRCREPCVHQELRAAAVEPWKVQRAPAKASSGSPQHHRSCISSLYRNTMLFDKLLL